MAEQTGFLTSTDGLKLYTKTWLPEGGTPQYKGVICLVHGFGEHCNRYQHVAEYFNKSGYAFVALDHRGHGQSAGKRGHAPNVDAYLNDIELLIYDIKIKYKDAPIFLYGHSMGGNLALNYVIKRKPSFAGVIVSGPWIQLAFEPKPIVLTMGKLMRSIYPSFTQGSGLVREHLSKDLAVVKANYDDPLINTNITASAGIGLSEAAAYLNTYDGDFALPLLMMHGDEDKITSQPASEAFSKRVKGDIAYKKWSGMYHEIHNEPDKQRVLDYMLGWLDSHV